jgi:hypothetical protein
MSYTGTTAEARLAAAVLTRLHAAQPDVNALRAAFKSADKRGLTPVEIVDGFIECNTTLSPLELQAVLEMLIDRELWVARDTLVDAVLAAPLPEPSDVELAGTATATAAPAAPELEPVLQAPAVMEAEEAPEQPAAPSVTMPSDWAPLAEPPVTATRLEQRQFYARHGRAAPFATYPAETAPQFPPERMRYLGGGTSARGAAGKSATPRGGGSVRAALLELPMQVPPTSRPSSSPPFALDEATGPMSALPQVAPSLPVAASARRAAPFATLTDEQSAYFAALGTSSERVGSSQWRPQSARSERAAGIVHDHGEAAGPISQRMSWMDSGATMSRPVSRRGDGTYRPKATSQFTFGP